MKELNRLFIKEFKKTISHRFRSDDDLQFSFFYHWNLIEKKFPHKISQGDSIEFLQISDNEDESIKKLSTIHDNEYKFICINDNMGDNENLNVKNALKEFFNRKIHKPSKFEK